MATKYNSLFWMVDRVVSCVRFTWHYALVFFYHGKGKTTVPPITNELLLKSATQLAREIREGTLKSKDVVQAYIERIEEVEPFINAVVDRRYQDALEEAMMVDSKIASGKYSKEQLANDKPLLGVPFTVKLTITVKGLRCTGGSRTYQNEVATEDASAVTLMKESGAIVIATTNVPEVGMGVESANYVHGRTYNPYDIHRSSGGSSGGESALIAAGGSVLGLGNDLLGSLRFPAMWTGIYAHKATRGLVSNEGLFPILDSSLNQYISTGPLCRYAEDLLISMKILSSHSEVAVKFEQKMDFENLKIYYLTEIISATVPPVEKEILEGLKSAINYFQNEFGVTAKEIKMPSMLDASRCLNTIIMKPIKSWKQLLLGSKEQNFHEKLDFLKLLFGKSYLTLGPLLLLNFCLCPILYRKKRYFHYQKMVEGWMKVFDNILEQDAVLLMPTFPVTAPYYYETFFSYFSFIYTALFNIFGLPSTQCHIGYNKHGIPYGIQIVAAKNNDALAISCAVQLEKAFGGWKNASQI